jgi:uncharacterized membrane protein YcfT
MQSPSVQVSTRMHWMDSLRGMAIILVVLFHSASSYRSLSGLDHAPVWDELTGFFDPYRMPMLLVLSGLLLPRALAKPLGTYMSGKARKILWPLVVWSTFQFVAERDVSQMLDPLEWLDGTFQWFLVVLVVCYSVAPLVRSLPAWVVALAFVVLLLTVGGHVTELRRIFFYGPYFFLGVMLSRRLSRIQAAPAWLAGLLGLVGIGVGIGSAADVLIVARYISWSIVLPLPGLLALLWLGARLPRSPLFEGIGRHSMVYYVTHTTVLVVTVDLWRAQDWATPWYTPLVLFTIIFGVSAFLAVNRVHFSGLFEFPRGRTVQQPRRQGEEVLSGTRGSGPTT